MTKKRKLTKFQKWTVGIGISALILTALAIGINQQIKSTIDFSMINKLGHYQKSSTNRSADVANPAQVTDTDARLIIEITHPQLILADAPANPADDNADVWMLYGLAPSPCPTIEQFASTGALIDEVYMQGIEYRTYTDTRVGIYNTHFYYVWEGHPELMENNVYALYVDFIDGTSNFHFEDELPMGYPEADIFGSDRPFNDVLGQPLQINAYVEVDTNPIKINALEDSPYLSFFQLEATTTNIETVTQTATTDVTNNTLLGNNTILITVISIASAFALATIIMIVILVVKKKK